MTIMYHFIVFSNGIHFFSFLKFYFIVLYEQN